MAAWTKSAAIAELEAILEEISHLQKQQRLSADHVRWHIKTLAFLEDVFGRDSRYYGTFESLPWRRTGSFMVGGVGDREGSLNPQGAIEREHQAAYIQQLEIARGLFQAAIDHLHRVDDIVEVYRGKDTAPEASAILKIMHLAEHRLRKVIRDRPTSELEVQNAFESLLIGADIDYKREKESIEYSSKTYTPDFTFPRLGLALDLKFCGSDNAEKRLIREINDYIMAFGTKYGNLAFVVYDLGFIRDVELFIGSFEQHQNLLMRIVKH